MARSLLRAKNWSEILRRTIAVLASIFIVVLGAWWFMESWAGRPVALDSPVTLVIERGESFSAIGHRLSDNGIVDSARPLTARGLIRGLTGSMRAGEYRFESNHSPDRVLDRLVSGDVLVHSVQIIEGETFSVTRHKLLEAPGLLFDLGNVTVVNVLAMLGLADAHGEGERDAALRGIDRLRRALAFALARIAPRTI